MNEGQDEQLLLLHHSFWCSILFYFHRLPLCLHCCRHSRRWVTLRLSPYFSGRLVFGWKNIKMTNVEASARLWFSAPELEDESWWKEIWSLCREHQRFSSKSLNVLRLSVKILANDHISFVSNGMNQQQNEPLRILTEAVRAPIRSLCCPVCLLLFMKATNCL